MDIIEYLSFVTSNIAQAALKNNKAEVCRLLRLLSEEAVRTANHIDEVPMETCHYPNCRAKALWIPVIALPTLRTVGDEKAMVVTKQPTLLLFVTVCQEHKETYRLTDWIAVGDWDAMRDVAHENGYAIPEPSLIVVEFKPLGWAPGAERLELVRGN